MENKDYYKILDINKSASKEEIKKAFRKLAQKYHPDKKDGNETKFKEVNEAYTVLSNEQKKAQYDMYGSAFSGDASSGASGFGGFGNGFGGFNTQQAQGFQDFDLGDIFGEFFGGGRSSRVRRGRDISMEMDITLEEAVFGIEKNISLNKTSKCKGCDGSGAEKGTSQKTCSACNGKGKTHQVQQSILGTIQTSKECAMCHGTGKIPEKKCSNCAGEGVLKGQTDFHIKIPAGIADGEAIRLSNVGEATAHGQTGDLYVRIFVRPHSKFIREGNNLIYNLDVKLTDAILGTKIEIESLDKKIIKVKVPDGLQINEILRIKNRGVSCRGRTGDLFIKTKIQIPKRLSREARKLIDELKDEGV